MLLRSLIAALSLAPVPAFAYIGPGAGISAIGTAIALIAALLLAIVGFFWYPLKRLMGGKKNKQATPQAGTKEQDPPA